LHGDGVCEPCIHGGIKSFFFSIKTGYDYRHEEIDGHRSPGRTGGRRILATCLEVPGANGQGETKEECLQNLKEAIQLLLETEREEVFRLDPQAETTELELA